MNPSKTKVIGHGGAKGYAPKDTRASFKRALELGVDAVELDLHQTRDGTPVVYHDPYLDRTTQHRGLIGEKWIQELKNMDVGSWFSPQFKNERILTLDEAMDFILGKAELIIELKQARRNRDVRYEGLERYVCQAIQKRDAYEKVVVTSFDHFSLLEVKKLDPKVKVGMLFGANWLTLWEEANKLNPYAILPHWVFTTQELVEEAHKCGIRVYVWVVNEESWMRKLFYWGVDGIVTDYPDKANKVYEELRRGKL